jgi:hypothetical protein
MLRTTQIDIFANFSRQSETKIILDTKALLVTNEFTRHIDV